LTPPSRVLNNATVIRPEARATALLLVAPFLTFASALAPQHVHGLGGGHDHGHAVAHSHFQPHEMGILQGKDVTEVERDIEHVVWLDGSILHEALYHAAPDPPAIPFSDEIVVAELHWSATAFDEAAPPHGPPKTVLRFRGPPPSLA
jgi:hypothetical protein